MTLLRRAFARVARERWWVENVCPDRKVYAAIVGMGPATKTEQLRAALCEMREYGRA